MHSLTNSRKNHQESNVSNDKNEYKNKKYLIAFISQLNVAKIDSYLNCNKIICASMFNIFSILIKMNKFSILYFFLFFHFENWFFFAFREIVFIIKSKAHRNKLLLFKMKHTIFHLFIVFLWHLHFCCW